MPSLHETTRKRICRTAFFALCFAPTLAMGAVVFTRHVPAFQQRRQQEIELHLSERLRVQASLAPQLTPKPGLTRYSIATLAAFASNEATTELEEIEVRTTSGAKVISIKSVMLTCDSLATLLQVAQREIQSPSAGPVLVNINRLTIAAANESEVPSDFTNVRLRFDHQDASDLKRVRLRANQASTSNEIAELHDAELNVIVEQQTDGTWKAKLDTGQIELPMQLASVVLPVLDGLHEGRFSGLAQWHSNRTRISGTLRGRIGGCQFGALLPGRFASQAAGQASVEIEELKFTGERIEKLSGVLNVDHGEVAADLFKNLESKLFCRPVIEHLATPGVTPQQVIPFDKLAARIVFTNKGLNIWGNFPEDSYMEEGRPVVRKYAKLMARDAKPLLLQPEWSDLPAAYWIQFAAGDAPSAMPASRKAFELAQRLPLPADAGEKK
ncbi:hypothetical protein [Adhaeretor mobilis]|uniref:AsmA-like C-terminal domain-containing protein n=1 Tax=Adhaeretor mobilis TaxID=1930276 RepID=A0A517N0H0_9BACT|nr:hypothetical protein [Adhaeretor mobilis]QDT00635.1 hypothetical protein HG15A2_39740 [Adhaeretor mobilis]